MQYGDGSAADSGAVDGSTGRRQYYIAIAHTYVAGGPKVARLTVTDANGRVGWREVQIYVQPLTDPSLEMLVRRNAAIQDGLRWLYLQQGGNGAFPYWQESYVSPTAAAVAAFEMRGHFGTNDPVQDIYAETVQAGLEYIFSNLTTEAISAQPYGNPDSNGDGVGIHSTASAKAYEHGLIMYAIALSRSPNVLA